jgi:hypothetical protein
MEDIALRICKEDAEWGNYNLPFVYSSISKAYELKADASTKPASGAAYSAAIKNLSEGISGWEKLGYATYLADAHMRLSNIYLKINETDKAKIHLDKGLKYSKMYSRKANLRSGYLLLARIDSMEGNYKNAFNNYKLYVDYRDSLQNEESTKKILQAKYGYEFSKKEDSLNLLQQISDGKLRQQQLIAIQNAQQLQIKEAALKLSEQQKELNQLAFLKTQGELQAEQLQRQEKEKQLVVAEKEAALQEANVKIKNTELGLKDKEMATKRVERNLLIACAAVLLLVGLVLLLNNRNKQRALVLLDKQKKETELQKQKVETTLLELKATQSQLIQAEKMASLGESQRASHMKFKIP